jgi:predicted MFS family arabinose efflux permease
VLTMTQVVVVALLTGSMSVVYGAASLSALPNVVAAEQLVPANAAQQASVSICAMAGPPLAGLVVALTGDAAAALAGNAVATLLAAGLLWRIRQPMRTSRPERPDSVLADIREGLGYLWRQRLVRTTAIPLFTYNVMLGGALGQLVVFGRQELHLNDFALSVLFAGEGAGTVLAAGLAGWAGRRWPLGRIVLMALPICAASVLLLGIAPGLPVALAAMVVLGVTQTVLFVNLIALRQKIVPDQLQGRVNATARAIAVGGLPLGAILAGALVVPLGGTRAVLLLLGAVALVNAVAGLATPLRTDTRRA